MLATWGCTTFPKPTLSLDFLGATSLDSGITFSRGSQATLFDSTGTLVYAKHNLLLQSQAFNTVASWSTFSVSMSADTTVAPNGTTTADTMTAVAAAATHDIRQTSASTAGTQRTFSLYAKAGTHQFVQLLFGTDVQAYANFDLTAGAVGTVGSAATASIINAGNGWYRCIVTTSSATATAIILIAMVSSGTAARLESWTTAGTETLHLWGAQLNLANMEGGVTSSLTTYYPTTTAAYYAPRFDYNPSTLQPRGLLIEEQRTNSIRNNTMQGAVAGTPGTLPTNWITIGAGIGTLTQQIVGTGTSNGITYIDVRISGTTSTVSFGISPESNTQISAASGQNWTSSIYLARVGGTTSNLTISQRVVERNGAGGGVGNTATNITSSLGTSLSRFSVTRTLADATTAFVTTDVLFEFLAGVAIDITLRIGLPQLEQGAFATSVIPTTTTALTRNADVASMTGTNFSSWYSASEGTIYANYRCFATSAFPDVFNISDGTNTNRQQQFIDASNGFTTFREVVSSVQQGVASQNSTMNTQIRSVGAYSSAGVVFTINGAAPTTNANVTHPTGLNRLNFGASGTGLGNYLNGYIQRISFWPTRLPNATLQALTL